MVLKSRKTILAFALLFSIFSSTFAIEIPAFKEYVNDYANVITPQDKREMISYLSSLEDSTGIQIAVLTMPSLKGEDITSFAIRTAEKWKVGQKGKDNGAILILAMEEREVRIEVGYGLEDKLTDVKCGLILRNVIIPDFQAGDFSKGLLHGVKNIAGVASNNAELISTKVQNNTESDGIEGLVFLIIWLIFFFSIISSKNGLLKWILLSKLFGSSNSNRHRPPTYRSNSMNYGGNFRGSSFSGGSSFHGGGGGHFGGGGATGHF